MTIKEEHTRLICKALNRTYGHREEAAKLLGITARTLYRYLGDYSIIKVKGKYIENDKNAENKDPGNKTKQ
jgi:DNA-binding NtrC family response regulator